MTMFEELVPPYRTIVVDPPWHYDDRMLGYRGDDRDARSMPYSTMSTQDIAAMPVCDLAEVGTDLYLWTTNRYLWVAKDIAYGWGFETSQVLTWCKPMDRMSPGGGKFFGTTEFILYAHRVGMAKRRGDQVGALIRSARINAEMTRAELHRLVRGGTPTGIVFRWEDDNALPNERDWIRIQEVLPELKNIDRPEAELRERKRINTSWFDWPRGRHSEKPKAFLDIVESVSDPAYVELFSRDRRLGWDSWGWGVDGTETS